MAIDTRERRASAISAGLPWLIFPPAADGTIDAGDRLQMCGYYRGIAAAGPAVTANYRGTVAAAARYVGTVATSARYIGTVEPYD